MIGIPYIKSLFQAILNQSKVINGRFHICPYWGAELNKGNIAEIVEYVKPYLNTTQKYPAALLMPIKTVGSFQYSGDNVSGASAYAGKEITMVFITNAYVTGQNQNSTPSPVTGKATHTIPDTWHDMERCAVDFLQVLYNVIQNTPELTSTVYIKEGLPQEILEVTNKADDQVTGVMLRFYLGWNSGCSIEDYEADYLETIVVPTVEDTHPLHLDV